MKEEYKRGMRVDIEMGLVGATNTGNFGKTADGQIGEMYSLSPHL